MVRLSQPFVLLIIFALRVSCFRTEISIKFRNLVHKNQYLRSARHDAIEEHTITQPVDHVAAKEKNVTFKQRYWVNPSYWRKSDGPVFLYIGGEFEMSGDFIDYGHIVDMAEKYGGLIFGVEHRFYGLSTFESCLDNYNLTFLSSPQALADLAAFVVFARDSYGMTDKNKWIAYGGSYPGSLAAWFKLKYPNLVSGAVASSAPVEAKTDFKEYNNVVASSFTSALVGGSEKCRDNIKKAFDEVDQLIAEKEFTTLERDFLSCRNLSSTNDTWLFSLNLANIFDSIVQYNDEGSGFSIASVCQYMTPAHVTPYENLVQFVQTFFPSTGLPCMNNNYASFLSSLNKTKQDPTGQSWDRQWTYQTCSEFGYYRTCDKNTSCLFSSRLADLSLFLGICSDIFGIPPKQVFENVAFTNYNYGGDKPKGSKTVFVNGSIDPWHALSVLSNQTSSQVAIFIPGTAHCANMNSDSPDDPLALRQARQEVSRLVGKWL